MSTISAEQLRAFIERLENLENEKKDVLELMKGVYQEAKGAGFDARVIRKIIARRKLDPDERSEADAMVDLYESAVEGRGEAEGAA